MEQKLINYINNLQAIGITLDPAYVEQLYNGIDAEIRNNATVILLPLAASEGVVYGMDNGNGNLISFTFSRVTKATLFDSNKDMQLVDSNIPRIDYANYADSAKLLIEKESTNLVIDSTFELGLNQTALGFTIEGANWFNFLPKKAVINHSDTTDYYYYKRCPQETDKVYSFSSFIFSEEKPVLNVTNNTSLGSLILNNSTQPDADTRLIKDSLWCSYSNNSRATTTSGGLNKGYVKYRQQNDILLQVAAYQWEESEHHTSYIPTTSSQVTRSADLLSINLPFNADVYLKTTKQENTLQKSVGLWNIHEDLNNEGIEVLAITNIDKISAVIFNTSEYIPEDVDRIKSVIINKENKGKNMAMFL